MGAKQRTSAGCASEASVLGLNVPGVGGHGSSSLISGFRIYRSLNRRQRMKDSPRASD